MLWIESSYMLHKTLLKEQLPLPRSHLSVSCHLTSLSSFSKQHCSFEESQAVHSGWKFYSSVSHVCGIIVVRLHIWSKNAQFILWLWVCSLYLLDLQAYPPKERDLLLLLFGTCLNVCWMWTRENCYIILVFYGVCSKEGLFSTLFMISTQLENVASLLVIFCSVI